MCAFLDKLDAIIIFFFCPSLYFSISILYKLLGKFNLASVDLNICSSISSFIIYSFRFPFKFDISCPTYDIFKSFGFTILPT